MSTIDEFGERLFGRKGRAVPLGRSGGKATRSDYMATLRRTVSRTPEVMVRITGSGKNMPTIRRHVAYIARRGTVELEDERGDTYVGEHAVRDALATWRPVGIPETGDRRRESFNIILSMKAGTDRASVKRAAQAFARTEFGESRPWVLAEHTDTAQPHSHVIVAASGYDGRRLNPRKADLQRWRETFAEKLREQGIEANATKRAARGVTRKGTAQAVYHMDRGAKAGERKPSRVSEAQRAAAAREALEGVQHENPAGERIRETRQAVLSSYAGIARDLLRGDEADRQLALDVTRFAAAMESAQSTKHQALVEEQGRAGERLSESEQDRGK